ncbi:Hypothetical predicted protein [Pelobates cultripes]|uniref:Uncharacterized protein n=1 Tax=Pelobates cultripes TaxID=61616 RepID=A0AAD1ST96_PELCU|nr:Hypothetical predicted protein [Pelobates cultripes]
MSLRSLAELIPEFNFKKWNRCGIAHLHDLQNKGTLLPFHDLSTRYTITSIAHFSYRQLRSWWLMHMKIPAPDHQTHFLTHFEKCLIEGAPAKGPISAIYTLLNTNTELCHLPWAKAWETDIGCKYPKTPGSKPSTATKADQYPPADKYLIYHIQIAALTHIARNWLSTSTATMQELTKYVSTVGSYEMHTASITTRQPWKREV